MKTTMINTFSSDIVISPTYLPDLINTSLDLLIDREKGIWHLSGPEAISYLNFANLALGIAGNTNTKIHSLPSIHLAMHARRPLYSALRSSGGIVLPPLDLSISNYLFDVERNYRA
jgi:dTDP-4-dehydrorhamnose reductase